MTVAREDKIREAMRAVGTYNEIFETSIRQLGKAERELSRAEKAWKASGGRLVAEMVSKTGQTYTAKDPQWAVVEQMRKDVTALRNQLGLTPTGLNKVRNAQQQSAGSASRMDQLLAAAHDYALDHASEIQADVDAYVSRVLSGEEGACQEIVLACRRYVSDLDTGKWEFRPEPPCEIIGIIETMICHQQGEALDATPMRGKPFLLLPYHKFIVWNIMGFFWPGSNRRRFQECLDFVPRKNIKTTFAASLAFALALYERASGSKVYEVGGALKQALEGFDFLKYNLRRLKVTVDDDPDGLRIIDNNMERSITGDVGDGFVSINALASNPDKQDSFNCNIVIADEAHTYKGPKQYQILKDATKAYTNKLVIIISSGGSNAQGFLAKRVEFCRRILDGTVKDAYAETIFVFIARAPTAENGEVDITNETVLRAASPGWGYSIRPQDMINDAAQAAADPQLRPEFLNKSLNVFTAALRAWFDIEEFRRSDRKYGWTLAELAKLPIRWYGGTDLSKLYDLTAAVTFGHYKGVDIIIPHCWFPRPAAMVKAQQDQIPLFGWKEDGWLDMTNDNTTNHVDVVRWYQQLREQGFRYRVIGHDRKFCREYFVAMKKARFPIRDQPQLFYRKSEGFRYLENSAKRGTLYYLHAEPFEYCVQNVAGVEKTDDAVQYEKIAPELRIDIFDAAVFAACAYLDDMTSKSAVAGAAAGSWFGGEEREGDAD